MTEQEKLDKVIKGIKDAINEEMDEPSCPYFEECRIDTGLMREVPVYMLDDALELLKEQEPHILPLEELQSIGETWNKNTPPFIWGEILDAPEWYTDDKIWVPYSFVRDTIKIGSEKYNRDSYMKRWRCWNNKPTDDQRKNTPWESD